MSYLGESPRPTNIRPGSARLLSANKSRSILRGPRCDSFVALKYGTMGSHLIPLSPSAVTIHLIHAH
ncbi:hypothetical protein ACCO45_001041 [Purpureocillium lilacinum]|uniref:Uncharacterized protein n=1 Tax=Purpureocillium lilacinum TaxID=33203 RepID=A0ACC4E797_PURLI